MKHTSLLPFATALAVGTLGLTATTQAFVITNTTNLPPEGVYVGPDIHAVYAGGALDYLLSLPQHAAIAGTTVVTPGGGGNPGDANDEIETFSSNLVAQMDVVQFPSGTSVIGGPQPIFANGPVTTIVLNRLLSPDGTGTFDTEMLQLNLSGNFGGTPFMIRESPTLASTGQTTVTDIGGGLYRIDSFFDVFTELSLDGGLSWMPSTNTTHTAPYAGHVNLIPEPSGMALTLLGLVGLLGFRRRH